MNNDKPEVTPVVADELVEFSPTQQGKLDQILKDRLAQQRQKHEEEMENLRQIARDRISQATGTKQTDVKQFLSASAYKAEQDQAELENLKRFFGNQPGAGRLSQNLVETNRPLYLEMRARYRELTGDPGRKVERILGFKDL